MSGASASETVAGRDIGSFLAGASEGESGEQVPGLAIQSASTHWTLTDATHTGDPNEAVIFRQTGDCLQRERLVSAPDADSFEAIDFAVDGQPDRLPRQARQRDRDAHVHARSDAHPVAAHSRRPRLCSDAASRRPSPCAGRSVAVTWRQ